MINNHQVLDPVIISDTIEMMNNFFGFKWSTQMLSHNKAVFSNIALVFCHTEKRVISGNTNPNIPFRSNGSATFPIIRLGTEGSALCFPTFPTHMSFCSLGTQLSALYTQDSLGFVPFTHMDSVLFLPAIWAELSFLAPKRIFLPAHGTDANMLALHNLIISDYRRIGNYYG